MLTYFI